MGLSRHTTEGTRSVRVPIENAVVLEGDLGVPSGPLGVVLFAHGSGSGRFSPRNQFVAAKLRGDWGLATLLIDLLTREEEAVDDVSGRLRFDLPFLAERLLAATDWLARDEETSGLPLGYFGASTGGGAALIAAAERPASVSAIVSRGGRPDLAGPFLHRVKAPTLLIVGGEDRVVVGLNQQAFAHLHAEKRLEIVPGATHLFEEPGALEIVADLAGDWFRRHLGPLRQA